MQTGGQSVEKSSSEQNVAEDHENNRKRTKVSELLKRLT